MKAIRISLKEELKLIPDAKLILTIANFEKRKGHEFLLDAMAEVLKSIPDGNYIEHEILRKEYFDPRIHFAVNCASFSCPRLLNIAYTEENLEKFANQNRWIFLFFHLLFRLLRLILPSRIAAVHSLKHRVSAALE